MLLDTTTMTVFASIPSITILLQGPQWRSVEKNCISLPQIRSGIFTSVSTKGEKMYLFKEKQSLWVVLYNLLSPN